MTMIAGKKAAMLTANGFCEQDMNTIQRLLDDQRVYTRIISVEQGLVRGWDGGHGWGHYYAVDCSLAKALAADYDMLVIPSGKRSHDKLRLTAHTKRFISGFMQAEKPVLAMGDALELMAFTDQLGGLAVSGPVDIENVALQAGAVWKDLPQYFDGNLVTGRVDDSSRDAFASAFVSYIGSYVPQNRVTDCAA